MSDTRGDLPTITAFPMQSVEKTRFGDTDAYGHINNAVVATFLESGRSELLRRSGTQIEADGCRFVLVRVEIDYRGELFFPGEVVVGTAVDDVGRSSVTFEQGVYQHGVCRTVSRSVLVHASAELKTAKALTPEARAHFARLGRLTA